MIRSWLRWPMLLGWALLLGQPACGTEEGSPEPGLPEDGVCEDQHLIDMIVDYHNLGIFGKMQKSVGVKKIKYLKAIGNLVTFQLYLAKTNCTIEDRENYYDRRYEAGEDEAAVPRCVLPPLAQQENLDCKFTAFMEAKHGWEAVVGHSCERFHEFQDEWMGRYRRFPFQELHQLFH